MRFKQSNDRIWKSRLISKVKKQDGAAAAGKSRKPADAAATLWTALSDDFRSKRAWQD